jgi:hypothetical protein
MENLGTKEERRRGRWIDGIPWRKQWTREERKRECYWNSESVPEHVGELPQSDKASERFVEFLVRDGKRKEGDEDLRGRNLFSVW